MEMMAQHMAQLQQTVAQQQQTISAVTRQAEADEARRELASMGYAMGSDGGEAYGFAQGSGASASTSHQVYAAEEARELTLAEQEKLSKSINGLSGNKLNQVMGIIQEAQREAGIDDDYDDGEVSMSVDELPTKTQLMLYNMLVMRGNSGGAGGRGGGGRGSGGGRGGSGRGRGGGRGRPKKNEASSSGLGAGVG